MFPCKPSAFWPLTALALALTGAPIAQAQPDPNNAPKADNPTNRPVRPQRPRGEMTPQQREEATKRFMKSQIERTGVTDEAAQEAVIQYIQDELDARQELQENSRALSNALRNQTLSDEQVAGLLNAYMGKVEDEKVRRAAAQKKLSATVDLLKAPRLEALLVLMGAWGDAPNSGVNMGLNMLRPRNNRRQNNADRPNRGQTTENAANA